MRTWKLVDPVRDESWRISRWPDGQVAVSGPVIVPADDDLAGIAWVAAARLEVVPADRLQPGYYLGQAVREVMATLNFYIGPGARTAVSHESVDQYYAIAHALARVEGKLCPRCDDTGIDKYTSHYGPMLCRFAGLPLHPKPGDAAQKSIDAYTEEREQKRAERELAADEEPEYNP